MDILGIYGSLAAINYDANADDFCVQNEERVMSSAEWGPFITKREQQVADIQNYQVEGCMTEDSCIAEVTCVAE